MAAGRLVVSTAVQGNNIDAGQNDAWAAIYNGALFDMAATASGNGEITTDYTSGSVIMASGNGHTFVVTLAAPVGFSFTLIQPTGVSNTQLSFQGAAQVAYWPRVSQTAAHRNILAASGFASLQCISLGANQWLVFNDTSGWAAN